MEVSETETEAELNELLRWLKKNYPLSESSKLLVAFLDAETVPQTEAAEEYYQANIGPPGAFYSHQPTRRLPYTGYIQVALKAENPKLTLIHEYRHAMQQAEGNLNLSSYWTLELDALEFAKEVYLKYEQLKTANGF